MDFEECEDISDDEFIADTQIILHTRLYKNAPTIQLEDEIKKLQSERSDLNIELQELRVLKNAEKQTLATISRWPILQQLADYLTGDFTHLVYIKDLELAKKEQVYLSKDVRTAKIGNNTDFSIFLMRSENFIDSKDSAIRVFKTKEEAIEYGVNKFIKYINDFDVNSYYQNRLVDFFNELYKNLDPKDVLKSDERISEAYNKKLKIVEAEQEKRNQEQIDKKLAEIEAEKEKLLSQKQ